MNTISLSNSGSDEIRLNPFVNQQLDNLVVVTGFLRGGTSLVGKLVGTLQGVEYAFEPPQVPYFDALTKQEGDLSFPQRELLKVYLYYDYFSNYLHGRKYNFRPSDDSCIFNMKSYQEVMEKWEAVPRIQDSLDVQRTQDPVFAFKSPTIYHLLPVLVEEFENLRIVDIERSPYRVVSSLLDKEWFLDENLGEDATGVWPFLQTDGEYMVPYLLKKSDAERWQKLDGPARSILFTARMLEYKLQCAEKISDRGTGKIFRLSFDRLLESPESSTRELSEFLDREFGKKTTLVIEEVSGTECKFDVDEMLEDCESDVRELYREKVSQYRSRYLTSD